MRPFNEDTKNARCRINYKNSFEGLGFSQWRQRNLNCSHFKGEKALTKISVAGIRMYLIRLEHLFNSDPEPT